MAPRKDGVHVLLIFLDFDMLALLLWQRRLTLRVALLETLMELLYNLRFFS